MLVIQKNQNNTLILTLNELKTLTSPTYLFKFTSDYNNTSKYFIQQDISLYPSRFNEFLITETSNPEILTSGTINLNPTGFWHYEVYEQLSTTNLNPELSDNRNPIEKGKLLVVGTAQEVKTHTNANITYKGYGNGQT